MMDDISCLYCSRRFSAKKDLYRHIQDFHPSETVGIYHAKNICCICNSAFTTISNLHSHIQLNHKGVKLLFQELVFYSESDFKEWKAKIEGDSCARFIKKRGSVEATDGKSLNFFYCHRSGIFEKKVFSQMRLKCTKTKKVRKTCPACITTSKIEHDGLCEIKVKYQSVHMGHEMQIGKIPLSVNDKSVFATQMSLDMSVSNVLKNEEFLFSHTINENSYCSRYAKVESMLENKRLKSNFEQDRAETMTDLRNLMLKCQSSNVSINELNIIAKGIEDIKKKLNINVQNHIPEILKCNPQKRIRTGID